METIFFKWMDESDMNVFHALKKAVWMKESYILNKTKCLS